MINYSLDTSIRRTISCTLMVISFLLVDPVNSFLGYLYDSLMNYLPFAKTPFAQLEVLGINITSFSVIGIYGILHLLFSLWIWKVPLVIKYTNVPNLNGVWTGKLCSSFVDPDTGLKIPPLDMKATIEQNWDSINITCEFPTSTSFSHIASISLNSPRGTVLAFSYMNNSSDIDSKSREYSGYNELIYINGCLKGFYFSNREEGTHGTISLTKKCIEKK